MQKRILELMTIQIENNIFIIHMHTRCTNIQTNPSKLMFATVNDIEGYEQWQSVSLK